MIENNTAERLVELDEDGSKAFDDEIKAACDDAATTANSNGFAESVEELSDPEESAARLAGRDDKKRNTKLGRKPLATPFVDGRQLTQVSGYLTLQPFDGLLDLNTRSFIRHPTLQTPGESDRRFRDRKAIVRRSISGITAEAASDIRIVQHTYRPSREQLDLFTDADAQSRPIQVFKGEEVDVVTTCGGRKCAVVIANPGEDVPKIGFIPLYNLTGLQRDWTPPTTLPVTPRKLRRTDEPIGVLDAFNRKLARLETVPEGAALEFDEVQLSGVGYSHIWLFR